LAACAQGGVGQFVYASSLAVYGPVEEGARIDEDTPFDDKPELRDPYSQSKIAADRLVSSFAQRTGLPAVILREGIIFGPGRPLSSGILAFRVGSTDVVFGDPQNRFPLNYVENLIDAMQVAAASGTGLRQFNVLDDDELTLAQYHETKSAVDHSRTRFSSPGRCTPRRRSWRRCGRSFPWATFGSPDISCGALCRIAGTTRASSANKTGWAPRVGLREAVQRTVDAGGLFLNKGNRVAERTRKADPSSA